MNLRMGVRIFYIRKDSPQRHKVNKEHKEKILKKKKKEFLVFPFTL
jgi:hypothetical protein